MASKRKKYNARFPAGRIKRIMQTDDEVGKVAKAVPVIISRTLELFVESLLKKAASVTMSRNAKTLSPSHLKQCIMAETRFDFLKDLVKNVPDVCTSDEMLSAESSPTRNHEQQAHPSKNNIYAPNPSTSAASTVRHKRSYPFGETAQIPMPKIENRAIDLSIKVNETRRNTPNFYKETLIDTCENDTKNLNASNCILNPIPSTSNAVQTTINNYRSTPDVIKSKIERKANIPPLKRIFRPDLTNAHQVRMPITPVLNIDFTKNIEKPEFNLINPGLSVPPIAKTLERSYSYDSLTNKRNKLNNVEPMPQFTAKTIGTGVIDEDYDT